MKTRILSVLIAVLAFLPTGCIAQYVNPHPVPLGTVRVWVDERQSYVGPLDAVQACAFWKPKGIQCVLVAHAEDADVKISIDTTDALTLARWRFTEARKGTMQWTHAMKPECLSTLPDPATATASDCTAAITHMDTGNVTVYPMCIGQDKLQMEYKAPLVRILAHEIGHALGVDHVPTSCDDKCVQYVNGADGKPICGSGIMNAPTANIDFITPADAAMFDHRAPNMPPRKP